MSSKLRNIALIFISVSLGHLLFDMVEPTSFESTISSAGGTVIDWSPTVSGHYSAYLVYRIDLLPIRVKENCLNWQSPPATNWEASLRVQAENSVLFAQKSLRMEPAMQIGRRAYFSIAAVRLKRFKPVEISLVPSEPPPFGSASPFISVRPEPGYYKTRYVECILWLLAYALSALFGVLLLINLRNVAHPNTL